MATDVRDTGTADEQPPSRTEMLRASPPMFASGLLDRFTRVHVAVVPAVFAPVILVHVLVASRHLATAPLLAWLLAGYVTWTLAEYWLHRIVFHFEPERGLGARLHWMIHGVHHDHPNDPLRLVMPPSASLPLGAVFVLLFHLVLPAGAAWALGAGFFAGYLAYDLTHFYLHHAVPGSRLGRRLREHHMRHHFQDDTTAFGISSPFWDRVFGTAPPRRP
ncbi:MAG: sterol desaturase family protein [Solirubrobacterales bacterium]|nr:sterol desaturase family protein [Solirubrobacterales bacterium]